MNRIKLFRPCNGTHGEAFIAELAIRKGMARENDAHDEAKAESSCSMGVGCGIAGVCYAEAHGEPDMCGRKEPRP